MRRRLRGINLASIVSALLLVATCVLWVRSYWRQDGRVSKQGTVQISVSSVRGGLHLVRMTSAYAFPSAYEGAEWFAQPAFASDTPDQRYGLRTLDRRLAGFAWIEGDAREGATYPGESPIPYRAIVVPWWSLAALFALLPVARWLPAFRRRSVAHGLCRNCGYDLRATPAEPTAGGALLGRCPECGTVANRP